MSRGDHLGVPGDGAPPGQRILGRLPVQHYGPIPRAANPSSWAMIFGGVTDSGTEHRLSVGDLDALPQTRVVADLHCAGKWSVKDNQWEGVLAAEVLRVFAPAPGAADVIAYAQYGYSTTLTVADLATDGVLLATRLNGEPLAPEHGFPVRLVVPHRYAYKSPKWFRGWEYLQTPQRGFWEERGYHLRGDPWQEERYSYQETHPRRPTGD